jgi:succinate-acetate transporter protein
MGLVTAVLAFYLSAADLMNEVYDRIVLPTGEPRIFKRHAVLL